MDNLSTVDKFAGPNVSFIKRFHCIMLSYRDLYYDYYICKKIDCAITPKLPHANVSNQFQLKAIRKVLQCSSVTQSHEFVMLYYI